MADLQQVDGRQEATLEQPRFDRCLGVAGQQRAELAEPKQHHHRAVVDIALRKRGCCVGIGRVEDFDRRRRIQQEPLARPGKQHAGGGLQDGVGHEVIVRRVFEADTGMQQRADSESGKHVDQAGDVVLMGMAQHQQVDSAGKERQVGAQATQGQLGVRAAVDEHGGASR